jgi:hypothetical protein
MSVTDETEQLAWVVLQTANRTQVRDSLVRLVVPRAEEGTRELESTLSLPNIYPAPLHVDTGTRPRRPLEALLHSYVDGAMQYSGCDFPRTPLLLGTLVNKGMKKGRSS